MLLVAPIVMGILPGEVGALAGWLVWGQGPFLRRLAVHWSIGLALLGCLLIGILAATADMPVNNGVVQEALVPLCLLPIMSLAVQLPMWPLRTHFGWRVEQISPDADAAKPIPLSILDILCGTAVVALSLGLVRATHLQGFFPFWIQVAVGLLIIFGASLIFLLPAMIFILRWKEAGTGVGLFAAYIFLGVLGVIAVPSAVAQSPPPGEAFIAMLTGFFAFAATLAAPLFVLRASGYRLTWPRDRQHEGL
jgi:hypothetical protein